MPERKVRQGESGDPPVRKERVFQSGDEWFFQTREGAAIGPYNSENAAQKGLENFIDFVQLASPQTRQMLIESLQAEARSKPGPRPLFQSDIA